MEVKVRGRVEVVGRGRGRGKRTGRAAFSQGRL